MLTERRKEFLRAVIRQYGLTGEPVHYTDVAEFIGVSKWTAYDILSALAREGYLEIVRRVDKKGSSPGRSQVTFRPAPSAYEAVALPSERKSGFQVDWERTRKELLHRLADADRKGPTVVLRETLAELPHASNPLVFCAKLIVALLLAVWAVRKTAQVLMVLREVLGYLSGPEAALILIVGLIMGYIWKSGKAELQDGLQRHINRYVSEVKNMDRREQEALLSFVQDVTDRWALSPTPS